MCGRGKTVVIGSDHAGYGVKSEIIRKLKVVGFEVEDLGTHSEAAADFTPIARAVAENVAVHAADRMGILICGTGIGMSIMANKVRGIRAALVHDLFSARATREHNNSNVLCMGARVIAPAMAWEIAKLWLGTESLGGKHEHRIQLISDYENSK